MPYIDMYPSIKKIPQVIYNMQTKRDKRRQKIKQVVWNNHFQITNK